MRCLYCGKELALLKRLRGGGDFCSDAHKQSYQEEYNRLALSRLLQAQKKGQQSNNSPAQNAAPPPQASVALEEPVRPGPEEASGPVLEVALMETALPEDAPSAVAIEESATEAVLASEVPADVEPPASEEPEPVETAGFLLDRPAIATLAEEAPHREPWLEVTAGPAMSEWQLKNGAALSPSPAELVVLDLLPKA